MHSPAAGPGARRRDPLSGMSHTHPAEISVRPAARRKLYKSTVSGATISPKGAFRSMRMNAWAAGAAIATPIRTHESATGTSTLGRDRVSTTPLLSHSSAVSDLCLRDCLPSAIATPTEEK